MIVLGGILICDDVQHIISRLLDHVGSPSQPRGSSDWRSFKSQSHSSQSKSRSQSSKSLSIGLRTSTHISVPVQKLAPLNELCTSLFPVYPLPKHDADDDDDNAPTLFGPSMKDISSPVPSHSQVPSLPSVTSPSSVSSFHLHRHDMHHIHAPQLVAREGVPYNITDVSFDDASIYEARASIKAALCDVDMACVVYCLQNNNDPSNIVSMIDAEAMLIIDDMDKSNNDLGNIVSMVDSTLNDMEKSNDDLGAIVSMMDSVLNDTEKNNDSLNNVVLMIDADNTKKKDNDSSIVVLMIDSTIDDMQKNDGDSSNIVLMIVSTVDNTKKKDNDSSNVVSMIDHAEAASTIGDMKKIDNNHNKESSDYDNNNTILVLRK